MAGDETGYTDPYETDITKITNFTPLLDVIRMSRGWSDGDTLYSSMFYGLNNQPGLVPMNPHIEGNGFVFFTKPVMNLSDANLIKDRKFMEMNSLNDKSVFRIVRAYLDPIGAIAGKRGSPLVDNSNPFICLLSNTCMSLSGWPDPQVDTYTSKEGLYGEQWMMYDGHIRMHRKFSLNANFLNGRNNPIGYLFSTWIAYGTYVYDDTMQARMSARVGRYIDYQTRIYRWVLDDTQTYVTRWATAVACIPTTYTAGSFYDYEAERYLNDTNKQMAVTFECLGCEYNDPICIKEFNESVWGVRADEAAIKSAYTKLSADNKPMFTRWAYPRVNPDTREFEWWIETEVFKALMAYRNGALQ